MSEQLVAHECGHAIGFLGRHPAEVESVTVWLRDGYAEIDPVFIGEDSVERLGVSLVSNWLLGSIAERIYLGERDILERAVEETDRWLEKLIDTKHRSAHDWECFRIVFSEYGDDFPMREFIDELLIGEKLIEKYLPRLNLSDLDLRLQRDGSFSLTRQDFVKTVH